MGVSFFPKTKWREVHSLYLLHSLYKECFEKPELGAQLTDTEPNSQPHSIASRSPNKVTDTSATVSTTPKKAPKQTTSEIFIPDAPKTLMKNTVPQNAFCASQPKT